MCCARGGGANDANRASKRAGDFPTAGAAGDDVALRVTAAAGSGFVTRFAAGKRAVASSSVSATHLANSQLAVAQSPYAEQESSRSRSSPDPCSSPCDARAVTSHGTTSNLSEWRVDDRCHELHFVAGAAGCTIADRCFH